MWQCPLHGEYPGVVACSIIGVAACTAFMHYGLQSPLTLKGAHPPHLTKYVISSHHQDLDDEDVFLNTLAQW